MKILNGFGDRLLADPPRADGDYRADHQTDQKTHWSGGSQQRRDDRDAQMFADATADRGDCERDGGADGQADCARKRSVIPASAWPGAGTFSPASTAWGSRKTANSVPIVLSASPMFRESCS